MDGRIVFCVGLYESERVAVMSGEDEMCMLVGCVFVLVRVITSFIVN